MALGPVFQTGEMAKDMGLGLSHRNMHTPAINSNKQKGPERLPLPPAAHQAHI